MENFPLKSYSNMVFLQPLNESEILSNLKLRYLNSIIFTYIGPSLLIMNPYKSIPFIYSDSLLLEILNKKDITQAHIYSLTLSTVLSLENNQRNQAIVISGESGAGKTESTKHCMRFLTYEKEKSLDKKTNKSISQRILDCNPILEAFGNAKTIKNDNSSRFGKYVCLLIDKKKKIDSFGVKGATITSYLLEKSRVVSQALNERNFHIFYYMLSGMSKKEKDEFFLGDKTPKEFNYLRKSLCYEIKGLNDVNSFEGVAQSFIELGFTALEINSIWRILSGVLLLGNIDFEDKGLNDINPCLIIDDKLIKEISSLLGVNKSELEKALVWKMREISKEIIYSPLTLSECHALKDSLSKILYERLFLFLVKRLNKTVFPEDLQDQPLSQVHKSIKIIRKSLSSAQGAFPYTSIGLLDIFGFENFANNSLEQLFINFTNEKLQQLYVAYLYKSEEAELKAEGFDYIISKYQDNQALLDLIEKYPISILDLLDESTSLASSTDEALLQSMEKAFIENEFIKVIPPKAFLISHTAKPVVYQIKGFRNKNHDEITRDLSALLSESQIPFISQSNKANTKKFLGGKFKSQIKDLITELLNCEVSFIRCLKPNEDKKPDDFNEELVLLQIKYLGLLDSIRIRQKGYEFRRSYHDFYIKYNEILPKKTINRDTQVLKDIIKGFIKDSWSDMIHEKSILFGKTKVFLKGKVAQILEEAVKTTKSLKIEKAQKILKQYKAYRFKKRLKFGLKKKKAIKFIEKILLKRILSKGFNSFYKLGIFKQKQRKKIKGLVKLMDIVKKRSIKYFWLIYLKQVKIKASQQKKSVRFSLNNENINSKQNEPFSNNKNPLEYEIPIKNIPFSNKTLSESETPLEKEPFCQNSVINVRKSILPKPAIKDPENSYYFEALFTNKDSSYVISNFSNIPKSVDCNLEIASLDQELLRKIKGSDFLLTVTPLLKPQKHWFSPIPANKLLSYQKNLISNSLQKLSGDKALFSLKIFKFILQYTYDKPSSYNLSLQVQRLLHIVLFNKEDSDLADEAYLLLIKQLRNNPNKPSRLRILRLLQIIASVRSTSLRLYFPVLNYLLEYLETSFEKEEKEAIRYIMSKIIKGFKKGFRKTIPSEHEIALIEFRKAIQVPINFLNGGYIILTIEPLTTASELIELVLIKLNKRSLLEYFGVEEVVSVGRKVLSEGFLDPEAFILDRVNLHELWKKNEEIYKPQLKFFFRIRVFYRFEERDLDSIDLLYSQYLTDIVKGKLFITKEILLKLIGFALIIDYGVFNKEKIQNMPLNLEKYIPQDMLLEKEEKYWLERVLESYESVDIGLEGLEYMKMRFLKALKENGLFFAHHFKGFYSKITVKAEEEVLNNKKESIWVVIRPLILEFWGIDGESFVIKRYEFNRITKWGRFEEKYLLIYTDDGEIHMIVSSEIKEIEFLIKNYVRIAMYLNVP